MTTMYNFMAFILASVSIAAAQTPSEVTVNVTGEDGQPITNAEVAVWYIGVTGKDDVKIAGNTNNKGTFKANGAADLRIKVEVTKDGYYKSEAHNLRRDTNHTLQIKLRESLKPRPLFAKTTTIQIPDLLHPHGFDLEIGDWVTPEGNGRTPDIIFAASKSVSASDDYRGTLSVAFSNSKDGIVEDPNWHPSSAFKSSRTAPSDGYAPSEEIIRNRSPKGGYENTPKKNYLLRLRTVVNDQGKIVSANYAKIYGGIEIFVGTNHPDRFGIQFTYYYNPDPNDKNLEFAPSRNLFTALETKEKVRSP